VGRMALIDEGRAGRCTLLIAPDRRDALACGSGLNTRSATLSGRHLCSPPLTGRAAAVGHLHPVARISGRRRNLARRCFVRNSERLAAFAANAGGLNVRDTTFVDVRRWRQPLAGPTINSSQIREEVPRAFPGALAPTLIVHRGFILLHSRLATRLSDFPRIIAHMRARGWRGFCG
jgi:hypothetical protein